jgi:hypothetical protein
MTSGVLQRFKKDERLVVLDGIDAIPTRRELYALGARGFICPYDPFTDTDTQDIIRWAENSYDDDTVMNRVFTTPAPDALDRAFDTLQNIFRQYTGSFCMAETRVNSTYPEEPHQHEETLSYAFSGLGTACVNAQGRKYHGPPRHILMIGEDVPHMAAQRLPKDHPKVTLLIV